MLSVTTKGQVTIPKAVRDAPGIKPGDEVAFEETEAGYVLQKEVPTTQAGRDPFETYRGSADSDASMPEWMRRLRGKHPRTSSSEESPETDETTSKQ